MTSGSSSDLDPEREVRRLHLMIEDWYADVRDNIDPIESSLASDFTWIGPEGTLYERDAGLEAWKSRRAEYLDSSPSVSVELEGLGIERTLYGVHQLTFLKRVRVDGEWEEYVCSLWLRETERVPSGLQWLHLTEVRRVVESSEE